MFGNLKKSCLKTLQLKNIDNPKISIRWSIENEDILVSWCDTAQCYKWLHARSHVKFSKMHAWFTIPAIILSTISGTASFATSSLPSNMQTLIRFQN